MILSILSSMIALAAEPSVLEGKWRQACKNGTLREETFSGDNATLTEMGFEDSLCSSPSFEFINDGQFILGNPVAQPNKATEIDFVFKKVSVNVHSASLVQTYNQVAMCGFQDWAVDQAKEVTGRSCAFFGVKSTVPGAGERRYGVYRVLNTYLFFGALTPEFDARSPAKRPREYNPYAFIKVE